MVSGLALVISLYVRRVSPAMTPVMAWLVSINVVTCCVLAVDKLTSKLRAGLVTESILLATAATGGSCGALVGMVAAHHKMVKSGFRLQLMGILVLQAVVIASYVLLVG
jgi:uncharacterized membrane protein YsdA (DUF1294 family)